MIKDTAYKKYQLHWMMQHGYFMDDLYDLIRKHDADPDSNMIDFQSYVETYGFGSGEMWISKDEFLNTLYQDRQYMKEILTEQELYEWREDTHNYSPIPDIVVETPKGTITATRSPDNEYPGIMVEIGNSGEINPGAMLEYTSDSNKVMLRVYGKEEPEGDPIEHIDLTPEYISPREDDLILKLTACMGSEYCYYIVRNISKEELKNQLMEYHAFINDIEERNVEDYLENNGAELIPWYTYQDDEYKEQYPVNFYDLEYNFDTGVYDIDNVYPEKQESIKKNRKEFFQL